MASKFQSLYACRSPRSSMREPIEDDATTLRFSPQHVDSTLTENNKRLTLEKLVLTRKSSTTKLLESDIKKLDASMYSTNIGKFGTYGGSFVPETLVSNYKKLDAEFNFAKNDPKFQDDRATDARDYIGRETPLYFAHRLTNHYKNKNGEGPEIYIKREDLSHGGAHTINKAFAQALLARRLGFMKVVAAIGAGTHGVATAATCAKLELKCTILMGDFDMKRRPSNVVLINLLGAEMDEYYKNISITVYHQLTAVVVLVAETHKLT